MMFGGAVQLIATLLFWSVELAGRYTALWDAPATTVPATVAHGFMMLYSLFVFFVFGFLMTTYPRWMNGEPIPQARYVSTFVLLFSGVLVSYLGLFTSRWIVALGTVLILAGYLAGLRALWCVFRAAPTRNKHYETLLNAALGMAALGVLSYLVWLFKEGWYLLELARQIGVWGFMTTVLVTVSHRMLPFFTSCVPGTEPVNQPRGGLMVMLGAVWLHGLLEIAGLLQWTWLVDLPLAVVAGYHLRQWGITRSMHVRLLAVLHIAFAWLVIAAALFAVRSLCIFATGLDYLARAPLHALGIGFFVGMTIAMVTRVTLGHSGRALEMDRYTWALFWGIGLSALLRIGGELPGAEHANLLAAGLLLVVLTLWAVRHIPIYLRPRVDGAPG